eukprot:PhF_6_TR6167/c0_g1_i1/m.9192
MQFSMQTGPHSYVEVRRTNVVSRFGNSLCGAFLGIILFLGAFPLLWMNEGWAVDAQQELDFIWENAIELDPKKSFDKNLAGKIVYLSCEARGTDGNLRDQIGRMEASVTNALKLQRNVEMYQWIEHTHTTKQKDVVGGGETEVKTYNYSPEWRSSHISSSFYKDSHVHHNPQFPFNDATFLAQGIKMCGYIPSNEIINTLPVSTPVQRPTGNYAYSGDASRPQVGDIRVHWNYAPAGYISVIAILDESGALVSSRHNHQLPIADVGAKSLGDLLTQKAQANSFLTWILRFVGWFLMIIGMLLIAEPGNVVADIIAPIGWITRNITGLASLFLSVGLSFITIAAAWVAYRPVFGCTLLAVGFGLFFFSQGLKTSRPKTQ